MGKKGSAMAMDASPRKKTRRKYLKQFDTILPALRSMVYGCYHRSQFQKLGITGSAYDECLRLLRFALPDAIASTRQAGGNVIRLRGDAYEGAENPLARLFELKTVPLTTMVCLLLIPAVLAAEGRPLTREELLDRMDTLVSQPGAAPLAEMLESHDMLSKVRRVLAALQAERLLSLATSSRALTYGLPRNPLAGLTADEAAWLLTAVRFASSVAPLTLPGWQLAETLRDLYPDASLRRRDALRFRHSNPARVLDDLLCARLLDDIRARRAVSFLYRGKKREGLPRALRTEFPYHRQYVILAQREKRGSESPFLISEITKLRELPADAKKRTRKRPAPRKAARLVLCLHAEGSARTGIEQRIGDRFADVRYTVEDGRTICRIAVQDPRRHLPWIRSLGTSVEILEETSGHLRATMQAQIEEALQAYE